MANLTSAFVLDSIYQVQRRGGRFVSTLQVLPTGLIDMLAWPNSHLNLHSTVKRVSSQDQEFGTLWGAKVWVNPTLVADTLYLIDDWMLIHSFKYPSTVQPSSVISSPTPLLSAVILPNSVPHECPCGIVRVDCEYHR